MKHYEHNKSLLMNMKCQTNSVYKFKNPSEKKKNIYIHDTHRNRYDGEKFKDPANIRLLKYTGRHMIDPVFL